MIVKVGPEQMDMVRACINSNFSLYKDIVSGEDLFEHDVDEAWAIRNYDIREFYILIDDDEGCPLAASSFQDLGTFAYIGYFYVMDGHQKKGHGTELMQYMEKRTLDAGITDLRLFLNPAATWAKKFYEKLGFEVFLTGKEEIMAVDGGIMRPFYEQNAWFLRKDLNGAAGRGK